MAYEPNPGCNAKAYRNTGTIGTPTWTEVAEIGDANLDEMTRNGAMLARRNNKFKKEISAQIEPIQFTLNMIHGLDETNFDAVRSNFFDGSVEEWAIAFGDITDSGTEYLRCPFRVANFPANQPLEEVMDHPVVLREGYLDDSGTEVDPSWNEVA